MNLAIRIKEFFMAKKSSKVILTYIITIALTLVITGGICYFAFSSVLSDEDKDTPETPLNGVELQPMTVLGDYTPSAEDARTALLILDAEKRESGSCFLIARFVPTEGQFVFLPIPSNKIGRASCRERVYVLV